MKSSINDVVAWPNVRAMCKQLKISTNYGYNLILNDKIAAVKVCGQWRVSPQAIEEYSKRKAR